MPQFKLRHMVALALAALSTLSPLSAHSAIDAAQAQAIYIESGAEQQLKQTGQLFPKGIRDGLANNPDGKRFDLNAAEQLARQAFDPAATRKPLTAALRGELTPADATAILAWLRSDLGRRITALDSAAREPQAEAEMVKFAEALQKQLPPDARLILIQSLDKAIRLTESATQMTMNMSIAAGLGSLGAQDSTAEEGLQRLRNEMEKERDFVAEAVAEQTFAHLLFTYRALSDEELRRYIDFANSSAGSAYFRVMASGMDRAVSLATQQLAQELTKLPANANAAAASAKTMQTNH